MKRTIIEFLIGLPVVVFLYVLFDYLYCTFISHSAFVFEMKNCFIFITAWLAVVIVMHIFRNRKNHQ